MTPCHCISERLTDSGKPLLRPTANGSVRRRAKAREAGAPLDEQCLFPQRWRRVAGLEHAVRARQIGGAGRKARGDEGHLIVAERRRAVRLAERDDQLHQRTERIARRGGAVVLAREDDGASSADPAGIRRTIQCEPSDPSTPSTSRWPSNRASRRWCWGTIESCSARSDVVKRSPICHERPSGWIAAQIQ